MTRLDRILAALALGLLLAWRTGCLLLRASGALYIVASLTELATGARPLTIAATLTLGGAAWLAGHRLDALRHRAYRSPLGERFLSERRWLR